MCGIRRLALRLVVAGLCSHRAAEVTGFVSHEVVRRWGWFGLSLLLSLTLQLILPVLHLIVFLIQLLHAGLHFIQVLVQFLEQSKK